MAQENTGVHPRLGPPYWFVPWKTRVAVSPTFFGGNKYPSSVSKNSVRLLTGNFPFNWWRRIRHPPPPPPHTHTPPRTSIFHFIPTRTASFTEFTSAVKKARGMWALCVSRTVHDQQLVSFRGMGDDLADAITALFPGLAREHDIDSVSFYCARELPTHPILQRDVDILNVADVE